MKLKKILAGAMAGAMVLGSLTITSAETTTDLLIDGLTAYYSFDDTLENAVTGASATLHGGAGDTWNSDATGTAAYDTGVEGKAYSFTGDSTDSSGNTVRGEGLKLDVTTTDAFTISLWLNTNEKVAYQPAVFMVYDADNWISSMTYVNGYSAATVLDIGGSWNWLDINNTDYNYYGQHNGDYAANTWVYVTIAVDTTSGDAALYYDGNLISKLTGLTGTSVYSGLEIFLGVNWWDTSYSGLMDELTIYNTALTATQVASLYANNGNPYVYGIYADSDTIYMTVDQTDSAADYITLVPSSLSASDVTYAVTEGSDYVSVTTDGTITALAKGDAVITATYGGSTSVTNKTATLNVSVTDPNSVTGITTSISEATLTVGNTLTISGTTVAEKSGSPITDKYSITYTSSDTSIATVNESTGVVTAVAAGTATITITVTGTDTDGEAYTYSTTVALTVEAAAVTTTEETTTEDTETTVSTGETESSEEDSEEVTYTLVDEYDVEDLTIESWWAAFTDSIALEESHQYVITGTTTDLGDYNWNNVLYVLFSSDDGVVYDSTSDEAAAANYVEYFVGRADNYGWQGTYNTAGELPDGMTYTCVSAPADDDEWAEWLAATQAGAEFTLTATYIDDTIQVEFVCGAVDYIITYTVADDSLTYYIALGGEACTLSNLHVADYEVSGVTLDTTTATTDATDTTGTDSDTTTTTSTTTTSSTGDADTGDASPIIPIAVAMLGCAAVVIAGKKRMA